MKLEKIHDMLEIVPATSADFGVIKKLAYQISPAIYGSIVSERNFF